MEKFIMAHDTAIRMLDTEGAEPVVVLLHGYLETIEIWEEFIPLLTPHFRVLALDLPGMGISQVKGEVHTMEFLADVVAGMLDKEGVETCCLVGHSMGGYVAEAFAAQYPGRLSGLVLFHSTANADSEEKKRDRKREIELIRSNKKELLAGMFAPKGFAAQNRKRLAHAIEAFEERIELNEDEGIIAILNGLMERRDQNETLRKLPVPQLFIFGRHDGFIPEEAAEKVILENPQAQVAWLEGSGHMGFIEEPERSAEILTEFVRKTTGDSRRKNASI